MGGGGEASFPESDRRKTIKFITVFILNSSSTFWVSHELQPPQIKKQNQTNKTTTKDEWVMFSQDSGTSLQ